MGLTANWQAGCAPKPEDEPGVGFRPGVWPIHPDEDERVRALHDFCLLDTDFESSFDRIATLAAHRFGTSISLVSLVDSKRQWFKASYGLDARETCRDAAFCTHAIMPNGPPIFEVTDATLDPRFGNNPLVTGLPSIRYYAGRPLICNKQPIGTLCIIDRSPRPPMSAADSEEFILYADMVVDLVEQRLLTKQYEVVQEQLIKKTDQMEGFNSGAKVYIYVYVCMCVYMSTYMYIYIYIYIYIIPSNVLTGERRARWHQGE